MADFDRVEALFARLLLASARVLTDAERAEIDDLIDNNEYAIALETAVAIYVEARKVPTTRAVQLVKELADEMQMDSAGLVGRLQALRRSPQDPLDEDEDR